ncbi:MAG TPA: TIGR00269 family protein [Acidobacteriota bacterium]|nr:TIGR00269 family protein [Acidobacteriota bacterium]
MKCVKCRGQAVLELRRHNSAFCREHFYEYFERQVERAVREFEMFSAADRVLVAVSGGKASLVSWDCLLRSGYRADGLYIGLGIPGYSDRSAEKVRAFAESRQVALRELSVPKEFGFDIPQAGKRLRRPACSPCGLTKRYLFNREALSGGYDVVATGHNLDDEAAVLLGNLLHWNTDYLGRQSPVLEARGEGLVRKVKPLVRVTERETAAYAVLRGIDYIVEECPMAVGAQSHLYKEVLNRLEQVSPGSKHQLLFGFLERGRGRFQSSRNLDLRPCEECGQPTTAKVCAFCRTRHLVSSAG